MIQLRDDLLIVDISNILIGQFFNLKYCFLRLTKKTNKQKKAHNKRTNYVQNLLLKLL